LRKGVFDQNGIGSITASEAYRKLASFSRAFDRSRPINPVKSNQRDRLAPPHGFRASFRSWCTAKKVPSEVAERCLAHESKDRTNAAYDGDEMLEDAARSWSGGRILERRRRLQRGADETGGGVIKLAISVEAFEAIAQTLRYEAETNERGELLIWLEAAMADRLAALRGSDESYSNTILRLVELEVRGER
jgi:hypothetical protein